MASTSQLGERIIEAGASGNLSKLREIRRKIDDAKEFNRICDEYCDYSTGRSVLHHAAAMGHLEICKFLIEKAKVYVNATAYKRETALTEAAKGGHFEIVKYLISQGAISIASLHGYTVLHYAVLNDNWELTLFLVKGGIRLDVNSSDGTPLQIAVSHGNVDIVKLLLVYGVKPDFCYFILESPLICAIKSHSLECLVWLLKAGADPNRFYLGYSPLSYAAKEHDTLYLEYLLCAGANPNKYLLGHMYPIEDAALANNRNAAELLFPLTRPIERYPEWSVDCIMEYCDSEYIKREREEYRSQCMAEIVENGHSSMARQYYALAVARFKLASNLDPSNPKWAAKRSLCSAHEGKRIIAMYEADECIKLWPRFPEPRPGEDSALGAKIFKTFMHSGLVFLLSPYDDQVLELFRVSLYDYFAWLYLMSSAEEITSMFYMPNYPC
ncbi:uncharacterized protein LOC131024632 [Salvia miltiorrhiza]|uniref:uncharacterized protein LOC131024632 n=1 Tax=Salvia miltiorrhiza TaxID=226208 RepID=UPI0025AB811F|nr:uncharacterized protein LOC131024632 [Salvia miltiorrhiza]